MVWYWWVVNKNGISDETNNATLNNILEKVSEISECVLAMGDINFSDIDWKYHLIRGPENSPDHVFL